VSDAFQLYKANYQVELRYVSGGVYQASWIEFQSELSTESISWSAIKNLYR
jgi:hypothetical protein